MFEIADAWSAEIASNLSDYFNIKEHDIFESMSSRLKKAHMFTNCQFHLIDVDIKE